MTALPPFHLAFPVHDLAAARAFYGGLLGCPEGRCSETWVDFDFFGHQIVAHLDPARVGSAHASGAVLPMAAWEKMAAKLTEAGAEFVIEPKVRFRGEIGEQATMFFLDPSGNALEIKAMADPAKLFANS